MTTSDSEATSTGPNQIADALGVHRPTPEQAAVIAGPTEPTLVLAGAGAGKTETMAARVVWLVANGHARPSEILGLTFTRKAAQQLSRRIRRRLDALARSPLCTGPGADPRIAESIRTEDPQISTYHAFAGNLLGSYGLLVPVEPDSRLLSPTAAFQLAYDVVSRWESPLTTGSSAGQVTRDVLTLAGQLSEHLVTTDELRAHPDLVSTLIATLPGGPGQRDAPTAWLETTATAQGHRDELADLVDAVAARMRSESALDHSSQMALAATVARDHPEVGEAERRAFRVVLLDEYQDTGHSQRVLLASLFGGAADPVPAVTAVGDPMQSIYGWRGASASNLDRFRDDFPRPGGEQSHLRELTTSWRNPPEVLALANRITLPLRDRPGSVPVPQLRARPGAEPADLRVAVTNTAAEERDWLADSLAARYRAVVDEGRVPTAAVLVRRNGDSAPIAEALEARGLQVEIVGVGGLLDVPEVADVVSLLTVVARPGAGAALVRLLSGSRFTLGAADLAALARRAATLSLRRPAAATGAVTTPEDLEDLLDAIARGEETDAAGLADALADPGQAGTYSPDGIARITELATIIAGLRAGASAPPARLVSAAEQALGLDAEVRLRERSGGGEAREQLDALREVAAGFRADRGSGLDAFLAHLDLARTVDGGLARGEVAATPGRVQILTVHSAKGLEWEIVAVPHLSVGVFPSDRAPQTSVRAATHLPEALRGDRESESNPGGVPVPRLDGVADRKLLESALRGHIDRVKRRSLDEDRRLFYVAVTRAERSLLLSASHWHGTGSTSRGPSEFLLEVLESCRGPEPLGQVDHLVVAPSTANPATQSVVEATWPRAAPPDRRAVALAVEQAVPVDPENDRAPDPGPARRWHLAAAALLADARRAAAKRDAVVLPRRLTAGEVVAMATDPGAFADRLRRPVPFRPDRFARRGTRFHLWLEHRYGATHLLDIDDLPGAGDRDAVDGLSESDLADLQQAFESSRWARLTPVDVEVPFEVGLGGHLLRGRMDAVFADGDDWIVVDWKTGRVPSERELPSVSLQLAVYRYAWTKVISARLGRTIEQDRVRAAFHYVRSGRTVEPTDLPDAEELLVLLGDGPGRGRLLSDEGR
ncbi:UvrD-helicase domain-containing protein [Rhodococcus sp. IEGM 1408]|uniref:UvrD-helicase domain-containing protein n=1 Tax=Rhodococcus sp. IEGM 1408 TaxID=3082220 RepID=UPI0029554486|nr:UvrD-helicase domain-containing protein [Rhodococcus sp. IEGM 1408]MDV8000852.1 UvrD-helicase domain-containing protein [Rhodococcus sp. IEGM 1408]